MSRNRIIYQSKDIFVSPTGGANAVQLYRIQSFSTNTEVARRDVNEFGKLAALDRIITEQPNVSAEMSYFLMDGQNEKSLGLVIDGVTNCISGILANEANMSQKNIYAITVPEGSDAHGIDPNTAGNISVGIGNAFLTGVYNGEDRQAAQAKIATTRKRTN